MGYSDEDTEYVDGDLYPEVGVNGLHCSISKKTHLEVLCLNDARYSLTCTVLAWLYSGVLMCRCSLREVKQDWNHSEVPTKKG